jgi:acetyl esterase
MKRCIIGMLILLCLICISGKRKYSSDPAGSCPEKYSTPEPGTCLQPSSYRVLKFLQAFNVRLSSFNAGLKILNTAVRSVEYAFDTIACFDSADIPLRFYFPSESALEKPYPVVLFLHGGGFVSGTIEECHYIVCKLCRVMNIPIIAVEYRLAPKHPFPDALNDVYTSWNWLVAHAEDLGIDPERMYIMGSSAGANLATVMTLKCRDMGVFPPAAQVLFYPPTTFSETPYPSRIYFLNDNNRSYVLTESYLRQCKACYMGDWEDECHPYLSPQEAVLTSDLPPALIITAQCDPLRDEGRCYAGLLRNAGVEAVLSEYPGMIHGFMGMYPFFEEAEASMREAGLFVSTH